jgi:hypothetical protein
MNQRIQELAVKAKLMAEEDINRQISYNTELKAFAEKFAELIVKECAAICINKNVSNLDLDIIREAGKFTLQDLATKSCGKNLSKQIKLHFGVE